MIDPNFTYAIVGASNNPDKYGYKVFQDLLGKGFRVVAVNPYEKEILGQRVYKNLSSFNKNIDVVIFVLSPKFSLPILTEVQNLGIKKVRFQPGAESDENIDFCKKNGIDCVYNACIMAQSLNN